MPYSIGGLARQLGVVIKFARDAKLVFPWLKADRIVPIVIAKVHQRCWIFENGVENAHTGWRRVHHSDIDAGDAIKDMMMARLRMTDDELATFRLQRGVAGRERSLLRQSADTADSDLALSRNTFE